MNNIRTFTIRITDVRGTVYIHEGCKKAGSITDIIDETVTSGGIRFWDVKGNCCVYVNMANVVTIEVEVMDDVEA